MSREIRDKLLEIAEEFEANLEISESNDEAKTWRVAAQLLRRHAEREEEPPSEAYLRTTQHQIKCPWCGGEMERKFEFHDRGGYFCFIGCPGCEARGPHVRSKEPDEDAYEAAEAKAREYLMSKPAKEGPAPICPGCGSNETDLRKYRKSGIFALRCNDPWHDPEES